MDKYALVDHKGQPIFECTAEELRYWLRHNRWWLVYNVRFGDPVQVISAADFLRRK